MLPSLFGRRTVAALSGAVAVVAALGFATAPSAVAATPHALPGPHVSRPHTHNASPAVITGAMSNHGGPVPDGSACLRRLLGLGSDPSGEQAYLDRFLASVGGTPWLATVNQYGAGSGGNLLAGTWSDGAAVPTSPNDAQIQAEALAAANHFGTGNSLNVQIVVATPTRALHARLRHPVLCLPRCGGGRPERHLHRPALHDRRRHRVRVELRQRG